MNVLNNDVEENINSIHSEKKERGDLTTRIIDYSERLQVFSWGLQNFFIDAYLTMDPARSLEQINYYKRKHGAKIDLEELQAEIEAFYTKYKVRPSAIQNACEKLNKILLTYNNLCITVDGIKILETADQDFRSFKYIEAFIKTKELQIQLDKIEFEGNLNTALQNLKQQAENQLALSLAQLSLDWSRVFTWRFTNGVDTQTYSLSVQQNDLILLQNLLKGLYYTNQMNAELNGFSDFFINKLVVKIIQHNCDIFTEEHTGALVFNIKIDLTNNEKPSIQTMFNNLMAVFEFLESTIESNFQADKKFLQYFGDNNREAFFDVIISNCVKPYLPICSQTYQTYKDIAAELDSFNNFLVKLLYVEHKKSPLNKYTSNLPILMYTTKCEKLLSDVRKITQNPLPQGTAIVGTQPNGEDKSFCDVIELKPDFNVHNPLFFPKCVVSQSATKIPELIMDHLKESATMPEEYGKQLALHVKNIATMYASLIPQMSKQNLKENPLEIALFFNNCNYLAHSLMGPPWKNILPKYLADYLNIILMEDIYDLRVTGLGQISMYLTDMSEEITKQINNISLPWSTEMFELFDQSVTNIMYDLHNLKRTWYDVLPSCMYVKSMCSLVSQLCEAMMMKLIPNVGHISEHVSHMIALKFQFTCKEICELFPEPIDFDAKIGRWKNFSQIYVLFTAHLLELSSLWNYNTLSNVFTCEEVRHIIRMRFPDNKYRLKILKEIQ